MKIVKSLLLALALYAGLPTGAWADNGSSFAANRTDFRDESIYFVMTTRFYDGDPANNVLCWDNQDAQRQTKDPCWRGDFQGLIDKLDYIKALGFSAIWITPVVQNGSGYDYHGYHAMDFSKVDSRYLSRRSDGSANDIDFQTLIDAAHKRGIKVVLDIVLNHTGNFGEANLCQEFTRNEKPSAQGSAEAALKPNFSLLGADYNDVTPGEQYQRRLALMKNTDGQNHDTNNYWHHFGNFNWDNETRWWAQIAGDCVDLNTENPDVYNYLVKCYGEFIKMGVDGFRIDTSGHIARLTFNKAFIPQFEALGRQYASARQGSGLGTAPFYMFGEVCARYGGAVYRDQAAMSPFFYTWKSETGGHSYAWSDDPAEYRGKNFPVSEGLSFSDTNRKSCEAEYADYNTGNTSDFNSTNAWLNGNNYHTPDYTNASGLNVIDFPVHYNFTSAASAYGMATDGDKLYNDATWNVVYVDSHDYGPQPNDGIRFNGGTSQWAENLTWMFLFRGIPCIYYGSEVEFMAGAPIDKGPNGPLSQTGRAYFGQNLEGNVSTSDFGTYTATGQVAKTLAHPLALHLSRLNRIRQAVPALRKGQYSTEGCNAQGGLAWKKRYTEGGVDSYALVCMNGGATFTGVLNGTYTDCVTGDRQTVTNGTLTASCSGQGNARIYVLNGPGKIGEDGPFLYASSPAAADNSSLASDPGTTWNDIVATPSPTVTLSPAGGTFTSDTQTITLSLANAETGWYQVGNGEQISFSGTATIEIGADMAYGQTTTVKWGATGTNDGTTETNTGEATYTKADPNAAITVYVKAASAPHLYAWATEGTTTTELNGSWPGNEMTATTVSGQTWYAKTFANATSVNVIFSDGNGQTEDIKGITADAYYQYNGGSSYSLTTISTDPTEPTDPETPTDPTTDTELSIKQGNILHCFDWAYADITAELPNIKAAGFTAVQTSPAQTNHTGSDVWNVLYRPRDSKIGPNMLGTKDDLKALCDAAHALGIKVIVDVVANHTDGSLDWVADYWKNTDLYHTLGGVSNWNDRWQVTHGEIGMKDLKTEDQRVYSKFKTYVQELKAIGVDGCRWDAAKHIGLPSEGDQFWKEVLDKDMFNYGEILDNTGGDDSKLLPEYLSYMSITDSPLGTNNVLGAAKQGQASSAGAGNYSFTYNTANLVYWGESHDTYCNADGASRGVDQSVVDRAYAVVASRNNIPALYFSRPSGDGPSARVPAKGSTHFTSKSVAEVNKFHNTMTGRADYYTANGSVASVTRKDGGAIVVNFQGSGNVSVANGGSYATPGTYVDRVSGNTWTITSTTISGQTDATGIAVLYDGNTTPTEPTDPTEVYTPTVVAGEVSCFLETPTEGTITAYVWKDSQPYASAWPGESMTRMGKAENGNTIYKWTYTGSRNDVPTGLLFVRNGQKIVDADIDFVNHGYYVEGVYNKTITAEGEEPTEPTTHTAYFVNTENWPTIYVWAWNSSNEAENYTGGTWPGQMATNTGLTSDDGYEIWQWTYNGTLPSTTMIIFSNGEGSSAGQTQTADLKFVDGYYYRLKTTNEEISTGISSTPSAKDGNDTWYTLSGVRINKPTQPGIYLHRGRKYIVR